MQEDSSGRPSPGSVLDHHAAVQLDLLSVAEQLQRDLVARKKKIQVLNDCGYSL
jgi:hypothetical protein